MEYVMEDLLTNESLRGVFKNNFELAHFAIQLGRHYINAGHEISLAGVLKEVKKHPSEEYLNELELVKKEKAEK